MNETQTLKRKVFYLKVDIYDIFSWINDLYVSGASINLVVLAIGVANAISSYFCLAVTHLDTADGFCNQC